MQPRFVALNIALLTISDTRSEETNFSGRLLTEKIRSCGHDVVQATIVADDVYLIRKELSNWIADSSIQVIITTGGTGVTSRDSTPEAVRPLLDKVFTHFGTVFSQISFSKIGASAIQSRALAGVANGHYIFVLPGSKSACRDAWDDILEHQLDARTLPCNLVQLIPRMVGN